MEKYAFKIVGMKCEGCLKKAKAALEAIKGVESVEIDLESGSTRIESSLPINDEKFVLAVSEVGFGLLPE